MGPTLAPAVRRMQSWSRDTLLPHIAGQVVGGTVLGLGLAAVGSLVRNTVGLVAMAALIGSVVLAYGLTELTGRPLWRFDSARQVPEGFRKTPYHRTMVFLWGIDLGFGWSTRQPSTAFLTMCLGALLLPPMWAVLAGVAFALTRGATVCVGLRATDIRDAECRFDRIKARAGVARIGSVASAGLVAGAAAMYLT